jgi:hypothetical protein
MAKEKRPKIATKFTEDQLVGYFNEHILYELLVLRYAHDRLSTTTQILWNTAFSAFNVSARNLYEFLNNKGTNNEVKRHEYTEYAKTFRLSPISDITGTLQLLNEQVFHMGRKRPAERDGKVTLERVERVFDWIEKNILQLLVSFEQEFRDKIQMQRADPYHWDGTLHISEAEAARPGTTNHIHELKAGGEHVLPAQDHTSLIQGSIFNVKK